MRQTNKRKTTIILIVMLMLLVEIIILGFSRANNIKEIQTTIKDYGENLKEDNLILNAINSGKDSYYIVLPDMINNKVVTSYFADLRSVGETPTSEENNTIKEEGEEQETEIAQAEEKVEQNTNVTTEVAQMEKKPGEKIYLTATEIEEQKLTLTVKYDEKEKNGEKLYKKQLEQIVEGKNISIKGYMPEDASISVEIANEEKTKETLKDILNNDITYQIAYDIKLLSNEKAYNPTDFDENVKVSITGVEQIDKENQKYKVVHINNENKVEEIEKIELKDNEVTFEASSFSTYAILLDNTMNLQNMALRASVPAKSVDSSLTDIWDGSTATGFTYGNGTSTFPYLIKSCAELAYLRDSVNSGTTYSGVYFQLVRNLDINGKYWTQIGTTANSFQGVFDGASYVIKNAKIAIGALTTSVDSYGFFGSVGGGTTKAEIRNVMFESINIEINATGTTAATTTQKGYHVGIVAGTLYKNSNIYNNSITNSSIICKDTLTLANNSFRLAVGGIAGFTARSLTGDAGNKEKDLTSLTYSIKSCFADVEIDIKAKCADDASAGQYAVGGIIGMIIEQQVWPEYCMYNGSIVSNGFAGPIFGYLKNTTAYTSTSNYLTLWQGNDAGNLTMTSAYSSPMKINGTSFSTSVTTGSSTSNIGFNAGKGATVLQGVQGINKGIAYNSTTDNITLLNNSGLSKSKYLTWESGYKLPSNYTNVTVEESNNKSTYSVTAKNTNTPLTFKWYVNGVAQSTTTSSFTKSPSWNETYKVDSIIKDNNGFYFLKSFEIPQLELKINFSIDEARNKVTAELVGTAKDLINESDYTYKWYTLDISGLTATEIKGETAAILTKLTEGQEYKLVATNNNNAELTREGKFVYKANRTVIYVNNTTGSNNNDGLTRTTPVKTIDHAYTKLSSDGTINTNIMVIMNNYTGSVFTQSTSIIEKNEKPVTITGAYDGQDERGTLLLAGGTNGRFLKGDVNFENLTFYGSTSTTGTGTVDLYLQGNKVKFGANITMDRYTQSDGLPDFDIYGGWKKLNEVYTSGVRTPTVEINSGQFNKIIMGNGIGSNNATNLNNTVSHNIMGSSSVNFSGIVTVDYIEQTQQKSIGLIAGGSEIGTLYSNPIINIKNGSIGKVIGGNYADSSYRPTSWAYPLNTFIGTSTINVTGGQVENIIGASYGRNANNTAIKSDAYYYGTININISGGIINSDIYGAGIGSTTGYNANSSDVYKSYGANKTTSTNINISGGTVNGSVYGGGYVFSENLTEAQQQLDSGALYGNSNVIISGSPTINGDIYGSGKGYNYSTVPNNSKMVGNTTVTISGTPTIGSSKVIYGAGNGTSLNTTAGLTGNTTININATVNKVIYGGGNSANVTGNTNVNLNSSNSLAIYGGGNGTGKVSAKSSVNINSGTYGTIYGGGQNTVGETSITATGGQARTIYGGGINNNSITTRSNVKIDGTIITGTVNGAGGTNSTTTTTNVTLTSSSATIPTVYGGSVLTTAKVTNTNINCNGATITNVYGGTNTSNVGTARLTINSGTITTAYGGNANGGTVTNTIVNGLGGQVTSLYGGGCSGNNFTYVGTATVNIRGTKIVTAVYGAGDTSSDTTTTKVTLESSSGSIPSVYGGGNSSTSQTTNANINCNGATITNLYGGAYNGSVVKTDVKVNSGTINNLYGGSAYSGMVKESTNITIQGGTISSAIYGGGYGASSKVGTAEANATANINIIKGTTAKIYGGGYNSIVYGNTNINIGKDAIGDTSSTVGNVIINGNIYGGAKATTASHTGVTGVSNINIDSNGYGTFAISQSIFGNGDNSNVTGDRNISIKNYGTSSLVKNILSVEKATHVIINNSTLHITGTTNTSNKYNTVKFAFNDIEHLKLANNSILYLDNGANLLKEYSSILIDSDGKETLETVKIDSSTGTVGSDIVTTNVDNKIYILQGSNLNIAQNEDVTIYGNVNGMTYLGMYTDSTNPAGTITRTGTNNVYVLGKHKANHNTAIDGFYTNISDNAHIHITATPKNANYYIWLIGTVPEGEQLETELTAYKYGTMDTAEVPLVNNSEPNTIFNVEEISSNLLSTISIKNKTQIPSVATSEDIANTTFGLEMQTGASGWTSNATTSYQIAKGGAKGNFSGNTEYVSDNSTQVPSLILNLFNSQNISQDSEVGYVTIGLDVLQPQSAIRFNISKLKLKVTIYTSKQQQPGYAIGVAPGEKFEAPFATVKTNITESSEFSTYYNLTIDNFSEYKYATSYPTSYRVLVSKDSTGYAYSLPEGTKITMIDLINSKYYYYIVTTSDVSNEKNEYKLSEFLEMPTQNKYYDETAAIATYQDTTNNTVQEKFIFHVDFKETTITQTSTDNTLFMELRNGDGRTIAGVLGSQRESGKYGIYVGKEAILDTRIQEIPTTIALGDSFNIKASSIFTQQVVNGNTIYDTQYLDKKMGITINIWDNTAQALLNGHELMGICYEINGITYYPNTNGTARIKIADNVANMLSNITVKTENNKTLTTGNYTIIVDTLASADGEYYQGDIRHHDKKEINIKNSEFGLKLTIADEDRIIEKGKTSITVNMEKSVVNITTPTFAVKAYRRDYTEELSTTYSEAINITAQATTPSFTVTLPTDLKTGTYKIVVELYDGETYIGEAHDYFIVK